MASEIDTSAEAVERLAAHITGGPHEAWEIVCASTLRALAAANARLERERDEAQLRAAEAVVAVNKFDRERMAEARLRHSMEKQRDAANAARLAADGERDRLREVLRNVLPHAWAAEYHEDWIGSGVRREACVAAEAALTPAPEAPK